MDGVTSVANKGLLLGPLRDDGHDNRWLNVAEVLVQWSVVGSLDSDDIGYTKFGGVHVCVWVHLGK